MSDTSIPSRRSRWLLWTALAVLGVLVVAAGAAWFARLTVAERVGARLLRGYGAPPVSARIVEIGPSGARLTGLSVGPDRVLEADEVTVAYALSELADGRVEHVEVLGPRLKVTIDAGGASLGSLDPLIASGRTGDGAKRGREPGRGSGRGSGLPRVDVKRAEIIAETPAGEIRLAGDASLRPAADGGAAIAADIAISTPLGTLAGRLASKIDPDGRFAGDFALSEGALAWGQAAGERIAGTVAFAGGGGKSPELTARLGAQSLRLAGARLTLPEATLEVRDDRLTASLAIEDEEGRAGLSLAAEVDARTAPMILQAEGEVRGTEASALWQTWNLPPLTDGRGEFSLTLTGSPAALSGGFSTSLEAREARPAGVALAKPSLALNATLSLLGSVLSVHADQGSVIRAEALRPAAGIAIAGPLELTLSPADGPLLELDLGEPARLPVRYAARLGQTPFRATLKTGPNDTLAFRGRTPQVVVSGSGDAAAPALVTEFEATDGLLTVPAYGLRFAGIGVEGRHIVPRPPSGAVAKFRVDALTIDTIDGKPPPLVPLSIDGEVGRANGRLTLAARLSDSAKRLALAVAGGHDPESGTGDAKFTLAPLAFAPGALQPGDLSPVLAKVLSEVSGRVSAAGTARWSASGLAVRATIPVRDLSLKIEGISLEGLNGDLVFDSAARRPPLQTVTIERLEMGLPLTDGRVRFRVTPDLVFEVEEMRWTLAGGRIFARDVTIDPFAADRRLVLEAEGIDVARILSQAGSDVVSATGTLSGRIPVRIVGGKVAISGGRLATDAPGVIRYQSGLSLEEVRQNRPEAALMLQALENFQYEGISMTVNQDPGGEAIIALQIRGKNPDFMEGHPFVFNLNLSGDLVEVVGCFIEGLCSAERIGQMLLQIFE